MILKIGASIVLLACITYGQDSKWVWDSNSRNEKSLRAPSGLKFEKLKDGARYNVYEDDDFDERPFGDRPYLGGNNRPINQGGYYPNNQRPLGGYGNGGGGHLGNGYGQGNFYPDEDRYQGGPIGPSYQKEGPFGDHDHCKCTEKFNCPSPAVSYGHCDVGKKYCCHITSVGGSSHKNIHSPENGILVGPGGPTGISAPHRPNGGFNQRPHGIGSYEGAGLYKRPYGGGSSGFGLGSRPHNTYSPENGILVGPGGPHGTLGVPGNYGHSYGRSNKE